MKPAIPALVALLQIRADEIDPVKAHGGRPEQQPATLRVGLRLLLHNRPLLVLTALCPCVLCVSQGIHSCFKQRAMEKVDRDTILVRGFAAVACIRCAAGS